MQKRRVERASLSQQKMRESNYVNWGFVPISGGKGAQCAGGKVVSGNKM